MGCHKPYFQVGSVVHIEGTAFMASHYDPLKNVYTLTVLQGAAKIHDIPVDRIDEYKY
mgnify:FL=1